MAPAGFGVPPFQDLGHGPIAIRGGYCEELRIPPVDERTEPRLQAPPESRAGDEAPGQGATQIRPADAAASGNLADRQAEEPLQYPHAVKVPPVPLREAGFWGVTRRNGVTAGMWDRFWGWAIVHGTVLDPKCGIVNVQGREYEPCGSNRRRFWRRRQDWANPLPQIPPIPPPRTPSFGSG